jgi:hypothetical protein
MKKEDFIKLGFSEEDAIKAAEASQEELKGFIPKARFDEVNNEKKKLETTVVERDTQLETLKNTTGDVEAMKTQITTLQADNKKKDDEHAAELKKLKRDAIDESILLESKAKNTKAVKALLEKIDDSVDEDSYKTLRSEQIKKLVEAEDTKFLFNVETKPGKGFKGVKPGEKKDGIAGDDKPATLSDAIRMHFEGNE